jgi:septal ring factor EnvC (AmiA/AmiB activator)
VATASIALALTAGVLTLPSGPADAGELRDKQDKVHRKVERANHDLDESSSALRRATRALSRSREQLTEARAELGDVRARLSIAQQQDAQMQQALADAEARLTQAQDDVATGKDALVEQQQAVVDTITSIYEQGDPGLQAIGSLMNAQTPADLTRQHEANNTMIDKQSNAYDDLHAAEVLLKVHENEVAEATAEVAEKRQEAADHLVEMQDLTQEALDAAHNGKVLTENYSSGWGNRLYLTVGLVNGKFNTVIYNHLSRYAASAGQVVRRGETIGYVGTTGWSTGCHLHFTVMENGHPVDPMKYF